MGQLSVGNLLTSLDCRYFCGLSATPKQQKTLIEEYFNACFTKNKAAARDGKHSVTFSECQELAKRVLAANKVPLKIELERSYLLNLTSPQITSFSNFFSGDPYIGSTRDELKKKNERIAELEKEVKRLRMEAGRSTYSRGRDLSRTESAEDKKRRYSPVSFIDVNSTLGACT